MNIESKPPEQIQAQIAAFAQEQVEYGPDKYAILSQIGTLAIEGPDEVTRKLPVPQVSMTPEGETKEYTHTTVATKEQYVGWLRQNRNARSEGVTGRQALLTNYDQFREPVASLRQQLAETPDPTTHADYLGDGNESFGFVLHTEDGKDHVVRLRRLNVQEGSAASADTYAARMMSGRKIPGLEHIEAMSYDDGVVISERAPGISGDKFSAEMFKNITEEQIDTAVTALQLMQQNNLKTDINTGNVLYDPAQGFTFIDYAPQDSGYVQPMSAKIWGFQHALAHGADTDFGKLNEIMPDTPEKFAFLGKEFAARLPVLHTLYDVCAKRFPNDERMLDDLQYYLTNLERSAVQYNDPQWVRETMEVRDAALAAQKENSVTNPDDPWL